MDANTSTAVASRQPSLSLCDHPSALPQRAHGLELLGHYRDSASIDRSYLARRHDGQVIHLSHLLYLVLSAVDGRRTTQEVGAWVSQEFGRIVSSANIEYLLANKLAPLGLIAGDREDSAPQFNGLLTVKVKRTLVPERAVQHVAAGLRPLFYPLIIAAVLASVVAFDAWLFLSARRELSPAAVQLVRNPLLFLFAIGAVLLGSLFHECGHATACRYGGARPGLIGAGFYVVWPAFFTDVTDSYRLSRAGKIRTDLGGVYFNLIFILAAAGIYLLTGFAPLLAVILLVHIEIFRQLVPSLRLDGYYILSDIVGVPDLFGRVGPILASLMPGRTADPRIRNLKRWTRIVVTVWVLSVVPILVFYLTLATLLGPHIVTTVAQTLSGQWRLISAAFGHGDVPTGLAGMISAIMLVLPLLGISYLLLSMSRLGVRLLLLLRTRLSATVHGVAAQRRRVPASAGTPAAPPLQEGSHLSKIPTTQMLTSRQEPPPTMIPSTATGSGEPATTLDPVAPSPYRPAGAAPLSTGPVARSEMPIMARTFGASATLAETAGPAAAVAAAAVLSAGEAGLAATEPSGRAYTDGDDVGSAPSPSPDVAAPLAKDAAPPSLWAGPSPGVCAASI